MYENSQANNGVFSLTLSITELRKSGGEHQHGSK
jgi:hypothetical protein